MTLQCPQCFHAPLSLRVLPHRLVLAACPYCGGTWPALLVHLNGGAMVLLNRD